MSRVSRVPLYTPPFLPSPTLHSFFKVDVCGWVGGDTRDTRDTCYAPGLKQPVTGRWVQGQESQPKEHPRRLAVHPALCWLNLWPQAF